MGARGPRRRPGRRAHPRPGRPRPGRRRRRGLGRLGHPACRRRRARQPHPGPGRRRLRPGRRAPYGRIAPADPGREPAAAGRAADVRVRLPDRRPHPQPHHPRSLGWPRSPRPSPNCATLSSAPPRPPPPAPPPNGCTPPPGPRRARAASPAPCPHDGRPRRDIVSRPASTTPPPAARTGPARRGPGSTAPGPQASTTPATRTQPLNLDGHGSSCPCGGQGAGHRSGHRVI